MRWRATWTCLGLGALVVGNATCAVLEEIPGGECGNGVVEPANREDCDPGTGNYAVENCGAVGTEQECRWTCSATVACPTEQAWGCGEGGICRLASGQFTPASSVATVGGAGDLVSGDFDGDGRADLVTATYDGYAAAFFDSAGQLAAVAPVAGGGEEVIARPVVTDLDADGLADIAIVRSDALVVARGGSDRTIDPVSYSPYSLDASAVRPLFVEVIEADAAAAPLEVGRGLELVVLLEPASGEDTTYVSCLSCGPDAQEQPFEYPARLLNTTSTAVGRWSFAHDLRPCDSIVLAQSGDTNVTVAAPCDESGYWSGAILTEPLFTVTLPSGAKVGSQYSYGQPDALRVADVNLDGKLDLLVLADSGAFEPAGCESATEGPGGAGGGPIPVGGAGGGGLMAPGGAGGAGGILAVGGAGGAGAGEPGTAGAGGTGDGPAGGYPTLWHVSYGTENGFRDDEGLPNRASSLCLHVPWLDANPPDDDLRWSLPLAVGDLNGDFRADLVFEGYVLMSFDGPARGSPGEISYRIEVFDGTWTSAAIADFNLDGYPDLLAAEEGVARLRFYQGAGGGAFNEFDVNLPAGLMGLSIGDYDGDRLLDVAVATGASTWAPGASNQGQTNRGELSIAFGSAYGGPEPPLTMARVPLVDLVSSGNLQLSLHSDGVDDIVLSSRAADESSLRFALLVGNANRRLFSPLSLTDEDDENHLPLSIAAGSFVSSSQDRQDLGVVTASSSALSCPMLDEAESAQKATESDWLLRFGEQASVETSGLVPDELPTDSSAGAYGVGYAWRYALTAALDLEGDGVDELVVLAPFARSCPANDYSGGVLVALRARADGLGWEPATASDVVLLDVAPGRFPGRSAGESSFEPDDPGAPPQGEGGMGQGTEHSGGAEREEIGSADLDMPITGRAEPVDLDGDGDLDLAVLAWLPPDEGMPLTAGRPVLVLFFNDRSGRLDSVPPVVMGGLPEAEFRDFAFLDADPAAGKEIVLATTSGVFLTTIVVEQDGSSGTASFGPARLLTTADVDRAVSSVAAADWNGDGVDDLAIGRAGRADILLGVSVLR